MEDLEPLAIAAFTFPRIGFHNLCQEFTPEAFRDTVSYLEKISGAGINLTINESSLHERICILRSRTVGPMKSLPVDSTITVTDGIEAMKKILNHLRTFNEIAFKCFEYNHSIEYEEEQVLAMAYVTIGRLSRTTGYHLPPLRGVGVNHTAAILNMLLVIANDRFPPRMSHIFPVGTPNPGVSISTGGTGITGASNLHSKQNAEDFRQDPDADSNAEQASDDECDAGWRRS